MQAYVLHGHKCYHMIDFCPNYIITLVTGADPLEFLTSSPHYLVVGKTPMAKNAPLKFFSLLSLHHILWISEKCTEILTDINEARIWASLSLFNCSFCMKKKWAQHGCLEA